MNNSRSYITHIPDDILVEILARLPMLYITRCKTVSKEWNSLISDKKFPGTISPKSPLTHLIWHTYNAADKFCTFTVDEQPHSPLNMSFLPLPRQSTDLFDILYSSNGLLLCMMNHALVLAVNPSNQTWFLLPSPPSYYSPANIALCPKALAFDPQISDYFKVLWPIPSEKYLRLLIFSSQSHTWEDFNLDCPQAGRFPFNKLSSMDFHCSMLHIHGIIYVVAFGRIFQLNLYEETINVIEMPPTDISWDLGHLVIRKGYLHRFAVTSTKTEGKVLTIWERELQSSSMTKWKSKHLFSQQLLSEGLELQPSDAFKHVRACFHPNKDAIFIKIGDVNLVYYDFENQKKKVLNVRRGKWHGELLPLSSCLVNLFQQNQLLKPGKREY